MYYVYGYTCKAHECNSQKKLAKLVSGHFFNLCREEHDRRALEANIKELQIRLEEAESNALRGGKKLIEKLEHQVRNLNEELDTEQRFKADLTKNMRKSERRYREIEFQHEEEKKITERLQVNCIQFTLKYELEHQRKEIGFCCKVYASKSKMFP